MDPASNRLSWHGPEPQVQLPVECQRVSKDPVTASPATDGRVLAHRYLVGELIGRGGMGDVFSGWDRVLERPVAVKVLREDAASSPVVRRRFEAEARAAARLVHPNIVQVYDSGEDLGVPFIVMERLPGRSLRDEIRTRRLRVPETIALALQVLAALASAHRAGLVHRDIKPANILSSEEGTWKVADFGIAKSLQPASGDETVTGMVIGTPAYLPPERLLGEEATPGADLYALGVILYEALAGSRPFDAPNPAGWIATAPASPTPLREIRPDVPPALGAAIERSLSRDSSQRFASADLMAQAIGSNAATGSPGGRGGDGAGWLAVPPAVPAEKGDTQILPPGATRPRRGWIAAIAGAAVVLVAATVGLAAAGGPSTSGRPTVPTTAVIQTSTLPAPTTVAPQPKTDQGKGNSGDHGARDQGDHGG